MLTHRCDRVKRRFHVERGVFESGIPSALHFKTARSTRNGLRERLEIPRNRIQEQPFHVERECPGFDRSYTTGFVSTWNRTFQSK